MDSKTITFETWARNHDDNHRAKWAREVYPWEVFQRLRYDALLIGHDQDIVVDNCRYSASIVARYIGDNGRINFKIHLVSVIQSRTQLWRQRAWDDLFHLVEDPDGGFITLYTEKKDPSELLTHRFFNAQFQLIQDVRSLPISGLLFRSLISYAAHESNPNFKRYSSFPVVPSRQSRGDRSLALYGVTFDPFLSLDRSLWIAYSFTEEKAHRLAIRLAGQADHIIVVYCHPTFSKHQRSNDSSIQVLSLIQFLRLLSPEIYGRFLQSTRFLINHLRLSNSDSTVTGSDSTEAIQSQIQSQTGTFKIETSELREAKGGLGIVVSTVGEAAYVCACGNLINSALNRTLGLYSGSIDLSKDVYQFKKMLGAAIEEMIENTIDGVSVYVSNDDLLYINVKGVQFSFHSIPRTEIIIKHRQSEVNVLQEWSGLRLQRIAPLVLKWARCLLAEESNYHKPRMD